MENRKWFAVWIKKLKVIIHRKPLLLVCHLQILLNIHILFRYMTSSHYLNYLSTKASPKRKIKKKNTPDITSSDLSVTHGKTSKGKKNCEMIHTMSHIITKEILLRLLDNVFSSLQPSNSSITISCDFFFFSSSFVVRKSPSFLCRSVTYVRIHYNS